MKILLLWPLVKTTNHLDFSKTKIVKNVIIPHYSLEYFENFQSWPNFGIKILFNWNSCIKIIDLLDTYQRPLKFLYNKSNLLFKLEYVKTS
jgi:hypothetical protein